LRDIGDARIELQASLNGTAVREIAPEKHFKMSRRAAMGTLAGAAAGAAGVATAVWHFWPTSAKPLMRVNIDVSPAQQFAGFT
jgi:ferric-dicitrate binding protein FerR (iron transport regulator)